MKKKKTLDGHTRLYNFNLHKRAFEIGWGFLNYVKYLIALFGLSSLNVKLTMIMGVIFGLICWGWGWFWLLSGGYEAEIEVSNTFNPFVKEMRESYSVSRKI